MLTGIHFLLSYQCTSECDHCFVYSSPRATGTFTAEQVVRVLDDAVRLGTIGTVFFEGGEPFVFYALLLRGLEAARDRGFTTGVVSNAYWAATDEDAVMWLEPLARAGLSILNVSDDAFHFSNFGDGVTETPAQRAVRAAEKLGLRVGAISVDVARVVRDGGKSIVQGGPMLRGRAAEKLAAGLPRVPCTGFTECPFEDLRNPDRVHVDAFGHVQLCQGVSMGNLWETPLPVLMRDYDPDVHPIAGPLLRGGPAALAAEHGFPTDAEYVSACHACYVLRSALRTRFPDALAPAQVYGMDPQIEQGALPV